MSKKKKITLATVAGILVLGGLLAACNGGGSSSPAGTGGGTTPPPVTEEPTDNTPPPTAYVPYDPNGEGLPLNVRQYIEETYPDSARKRAALFQYAKVMEKALTDAHSKDLSIQHAREDDLAGACLWYTFGTVGAYGDAEEKLRPIILNTDERNMAYFTYNDQLGGQVFKGIPHDERASACDINPASLPN